MKIRTPSKFERIGLTVMGITAVLMWILAHLLFSSSQGFEHEVSWIAGLTTPAIYLFWIALVVYHFGLFSISARSIIVNEKNNVTDSIMLVIGILGVTLVIISLLGRYYFGSGEVVWFYNIKQMSIFYSGILMEIAALLYYAFTE